MALLKHMKISWEDWRNLSTFDPDTEYTVTNSKGQVSFRSIGNSVFASGAPILSYENMTTSRQVFSYEDFGKNLLESEARVTIVLYQKNKGYDLDTFEETRRTSTRLGFSTEVDNEYYIRIDDYLTEERDANIANFVSLRLEEDNKINLHVSLNPNRSVGVLQYYYVDIFIG